ncbi:unnamed protein product [Rhodiola kirilowii]
MDGGVPEEGIERFEGLAATDHVEDRQLDSSRVFTRLWRRQLLASGGGMP